MSERPRIGFGGLGLMGAPMVRRLVSRGWQVAVWNREPERYAEVKDVTVLDGPHQVREASDIVIFCVLNGDAVEECCFGPKGLARAKSGASLVIDCSTINPDRTRALAGRLKTEADMGWVAAPISGGPAAAGEDNLTILMGGAQSDIAQATPVLADLATGRARGGARGAGRAAGGGGRAGGGV